MYRLIAFMQSGPQLIVRTSRCPLDTRPRVHTLQTNNKEKEND